MVIGRGRRREHPNQHCLLLLRVLLNFRLCMRTPKETPKGSTEVTSVTWPEVALSWRMFCACPIFPHVFFLVVVTWLPDVTKDQLTPSVFPWVCACSCPHILLTIIFACLSWLSIAPERWRTRLLSVLQFGHNTFEPYPSSLNTVPHTIWILLSNVMHLWAKYVYIHQPPETADIYYQI
jgi:hypothetical protein